MRCTVESSLALPIGRRNQSGIAVISALSWAGCNEVIEMEARCKSAVGQGYYAFGQGLSLKYHHDTNCELHKQEFYKTLQLMTFIPKYTLPQSIKFLDIVRGFSRSSG